MTTQAELYACVRVPEFPAQALLRLRPDLRQRPCVILDGEPPLQFVCSRNRLAARQGVADGMTPVELDTFPLVTRLHRSKPEENSTRLVLLECAGAFSPRMEERCCGKEFACILDIAGTESLFGPPQKLAERLVERLQLLGISSNVAVSRNFHVALCVARARLQPITVVAAGEERQRIAPLAVSLVTLSHQQAETLSLWGITTLGMLAALPEIELIARMGQDSQRLRQLARGELPHLLQPVETAFALEETMELDTPVELLDSLLFVIRVMLEQLITRAVARMLALASVTVTLSLERNAGEGHATHTRTVRPAVPAIDPQLWLKLLQLDLQAHPPSAAIVSLTLKAEPGSTSKVQQGLFSPQLPEPGRLDVTLARIRAIVGDGNVGRAVLKDTHEPDAFRVEPFTLPNTRPAAVPSPVPRAAVRQLRPAEEIGVTLQGKRPSVLVFREIRYTVEQAYGPWLTSGNWWNPSLWSQEQWDLIAASQDGARLSCCVVRDRFQNRWQMAALYD
jgi:protein ImuB